jgi:hypothetical protein
MKVFYNDLDWSNLYITKNVDHVNQPVNEIRIQLPLRLLWVCVSGHEHRWRLTAWLCGRWQKLKGEQK